MGNVKLFLTALIMVVGMASNAQIMDTIIVSELTPMNSTPAPEAKSTIITIKIFASDKGKKNETKISFKWVRPKSERDRSNAETIAKVKSIFASNKIDCPMLWTDRGNGIVKCANGNTIAISGAPPSFMTAFSHQ
jgi:hypothetical protein